MDTFHEWIQAEALTGWKKLAAMGAMGVGLGGNARADMPASPSPMQQAPMAAPVEVKFSNDYSVITATVKRKAEHDKRAYWVEAKHKMETVVLNNTRLNDLVIQYNTPKFIGRGDKVDVEVRVRYFRPDSAGMVAVPSMEVAEIAKKNEK